MELTGAAASRAGARRSAVAAFLPVAAAWAVLVAVGLALRPLLPIDETRYATVAWEMWLRGDWLVPHLNGVPYSDKPPLLFWLIHALWAAFGVHEALARLVPPLFGLGSLYLTAIVARRLWPERPGIAGIAGMARQAPAVLLGTLLWTLFSSSLMFDMMVAFFDLAALAAMLAARDGRRWGWPLAGAALGLGILTKGPVVLLAPVAVGLAAPLWQRRERGDDGAEGDLIGPRGRDGRPGSMRWGRWYAGLALAVVLAAALALAWALPAAAAGGPQYGDTLLFKQTGERVVSSFAHRRPLWWYLPLLPGLLFPYALWPPLWRAVARQARERRRLDAGTRFCLAWIVPAFVCFSLISGKQPHYLMPLLPAFALLVARAADGDLAVRRWDLLPALGLVALFGLAVALAPLCAGRPGVPGWLAAVRPLPGLALASVAAMAAAALVSLPARPAGGALAGLLQRPAALAALTLGTVIALHLAAAPVAAQRYDIGSLARHLGDLERRGVPIAWVTKYHGQLHFMGRLRRPFAVLPRGAEGRWLAEHPTGRVVAERDDVHPPAASIERSHPYRDGELIVFGASLQR